MVRANAIPVNNNHHSGNIHHSGLSAGENVERMLTKIRHGKAMSKARFESVPSAFSDTTFRRTIRNPTTPIPRSTITD